MELTVDKRKLEHLTQQLSNGEKGKAHTSSQVSFLGKQTPKRFARRRSTEEHPQDQHHRGQRKQDTEEKACCYAVTTEASAKLPGSYPPGMAQEGCPELRQRYQTLVPAHQAIL